MFLGIKIILLPDSILLSEVGVTHIFIAQGVLTPNSLVHTAHDS